MTIDLSPLVSALAPLALAAVTAGISIIVPALLKRLHLANNADLSAKLVTAADAAAGEAYRQAVLHGHDLTIAAGQNAGVAIAASYVLAQVPDTLKQLGVTPDTVTAMVGARLGTLLAADPTVSTQAAAPTPQAAPATEPAPAATPSTPAPAS